MIRTFAVLFLLWATPAFSANPKLTIVLDWFVNPNHAPLVIAQQDGLFAKHGVDVDIKAPADPSDAPKLVAAGKADLGIGYQPQLLLQVEAGLPLVRVGTLIATPLSTVTVLESSGIRSLADLKGRTVGVSLGGLEEKTLATLLQRHGLTLKDITMVQTGFALAPALLARRVDAIVGAYRNVEIPQLALEGINTRAFYVEEEGVPPYDALIFIANPQKLDRAAVGRFLDALEEAAIRLQNHPDETLQAFIRAYPELDTPLTRAAWPLTIPRFAHTPRALDVHRYDRYAHYMVENGLLPRPLPVSQYAIALD